MFLYRDINLDSNLITKYKVGLEIIEKSYLYLSFQEKEIITNCRFLIVISDPFKSIIYINEEVEEGYLLLLPNACFKVLDNYQYKDSTQIVLLLISTVHNLKTNLIDENQIVYKSRIQFEENFSNLRNCQKCDQKSLEINFPIGMDESGLFY